MKIGRRMVEFRTTDALVRNPNWNIIVQKTGYITEAGRCLVMQAVIGGRNVVIVLLIPSASTPASPMRCGCAAGSRRA